MTWKYPELSSLCLASHQDDRIPSCLLMSMTTTMTWRYPESSISWESWYCASHAHEQTECVCWMARKRWKIFVPQSLTDFTCITDERKTAANMRLLSSDVEDSELEINRPVPTRSTEIFSFHISNQQLSKPQASQQSLTTSTTTTIHHNHHPPQQQPPTTTTHHQLSQNAIQGHLRSCLRLRRHRYPNHQYVPSSTAICKQTLTTEQPHSSRAARP